MRDSELITKVKKEIKSLEVELTESSAQLGGVFYDSGIALSDSDTIKELDELEERIPDIKSRMESLQGYNLSIFESEKRLKECRLKIKEMETKLSSVFEKVGVELYCVIGEKELSFSSVKVIFDKLKEGEHKSESLESTLYQYENSSVKKNLGDIISKPFKVRSIKYGIKQNNKESLNTFRELGRAYTEIPQLVDEEGNDSISGILEDYKVLNKSLNNQKDTLDNLNSRIVENEEKIQEGSHGIKLKTLYTRLEREIADTQNSISDKLVILGFYVADCTDLNLDNIEILGKLEYFNKKKENIRKKETELYYLESKVKQSNLLKEILDRENIIKIEGEHIKTLRDKLEKNKADLNILNQESEIMSKWLSDNQIDGES